MIGNALVVEDRSSGDSVMRRRATRLWRLPKTVMVLLREEQGRWMWRRWLWFFVSTDLK
jgi:hypothetical protein